MPRRAIHRLQNNSSMRIVTEGILVRLPRVSISDLKRGQINVFHLSVWSYLPGEVYFFMGKAQISVLDAVFL